MHQQPAVSDITAVVAATRGVVLVVAAAAHREHTAFLSFPTCTTVMISAVQPSVEHLGRPHTLRAGRPGCTGVWVRHDGPGLYRERRVPQPAVSHTRPVPCVAGARPCRPMRCIVPMFCMFRLLPDLITPALTGVIYVILAQRRE